jgi:spermidine synthase
MFKAKSGDERERLLIYLLVFFSSFMVLFLEMIEPKLFQFQKVFGHEMGVVAVAMLGLGVAGLWSFYLGHWERSVLGLSVLGLGPAMTLSFFITVLLPNSSLAGASPLWHFALSGITALVCSLPYFCSGLIASWAYIHFSSWRIYGLSMIGSGLGITLTYVCLPGLGAEGSLLAAGAMASLLGVLMAPALVRARGFSGWRISGSILFGLCLLLLGAHLLTGCFDLLKLAPRHPRARELTEPGQFATEARALPGSRVLASKWSAISRVDALSTPALTMERLSSSPGLGPSPAPNPRFQAELAESFQTTTHLYANNVWFSSLPEKAPLKSWFIPYTLLHRPRVLVIGVGGGIDLARALALSPKRLVGVEINPSLVELMSGPLAPASSHVYNRSEIVVMDGRSYVHSSKEKFDLITLVFADLYIPFHNSNIFMESYLYTVEGFEDYLGRLSETGYLSVTKMVGSLQAPTELLRITATALAALRRAGLTNPERNLVVIGFSSGRENAYGGSLLVKREPFTAVELAEIRAELSPPLFALYLPGDHGGENPFVRLLTAPDPQAFYKSYPLNVEPVTDNKPFFYLFDRSLALHRNSVLFFLALTAAVFWVPFAAIVLQKTRRREPVYFSGLAIIALLALGYIFVESALIQRLNLYLGGPLYSLSTVTAAYLIYPGLMSLLAGRLGKAGFRDLLLAVPLSLFLYEPLLRGLVAVLPPFSSATRMLIVFLLLAPLCLPLGLPFPFLLDQIKDRAGRKSAGLFYGVSASAGVLVVSLSLYFSARFGVHALYLTGATAYLAVALLARILFPSRPQSASSDVASLPLTGNRSQRL